MKKTITTIVVFIISAITISSCRQSYGCACIYKVAGVVDTTIGVDVLYVDRNEAGSRCSRAEVTYDGLWGASDSTGCTLLGYK